jgi:hypothetical protein
MGLGDIRYVVSRRVPDFMARDHRRENGILATPKSIWGRRMKSIIIAAVLAAFTAGTAAAADEATVYVWRPQGGQYGSQILPQNAFASPPGESEGGGSGYDFESERFGSLSKYYPIAAHTLSVGEMLTFTVPRSLKVTCHLMSDINGRRPTNWLELAQKESQVTVKALATGRLAAAVWCAETVPVDGQSYLQVEYLDLSINA